ncbi:hypothetical protein NicSoilB4_01280 [Arthrobacter sp. NicSoilB4]|nr:hypothetical protein NicSoilB4_01280 [Arthrobacter sp. NicSoilB4]
MLTFRPGFGIEAAALSHERMQHNASALGGGWARIWDDGVGGSYLGRRRLDPVPPVG